MRRIQLFEFEDQKWFPAFLRNYGTDYLQFVSNTTKMYKPIVPIIERGLKKSKTNHIVDLCSGGGGGLLWLNRELKKGIPDLKIILADLYPNIPAFGCTQSKADNIDFITEPLDARNVPPEVKGFRTHFLSFHHFGPSDAKLILQNAVDSKSSIGIFEAQERSLPSILGMIMAPLSMILVTPFIRPFKIGRIIFTYLIPVVPLMSLWDGMISSLRTYSVKEMKELIEDLDGKEDFDWEVNRIKSGPMVMLYLLGTKN